MFSEDGSKPRKLAVEELYLLYITLGSKSHSLHAKSLQ